MTDRPRRAKDKDASTRFMRVEQLFAARTVEVPAATLLARAAAGETKLAVAETVATRRREAPTTAMPIAHAKTEPAPTVLRRQIADHPPKATQLRMTSQAGRDEKLPSRARLRVRLTARRIAQTLIAIAVAGALTWTAKRLSMTDRPAMPARADALQLQQLQERNTPGTEAAPTPAAAPTTATEPTATAGDDAPVVLPSIAADQLAAGDDAAALASYRALALARPDERVYSLIVHVLERRLRARCPKDPTSGTPTCAR